MTLPADLLPLGGPHAIGATVFAALVADFGSQARVLDNPVRASALQDGERIVWIEDVTDKRVDEAGGQQKREYTFNLGVINRSADARTGAHSDYRRAKRVTRDSLAGLRAKLVVISGLREGDVIYRVENVDVGGGLVLAAFSLQYRDPG